MVSPKKFKMNFLIIINIFFLVLFSFAKGSFSPSEDSLKSAPQEHKTFKAPDPSFRLPNSFIPNHYELRIRPILDDNPSDLRQYSAPGVIVIYGTCVQNTTNITLHSQVAINETTVRVRHIITNLEVPINGHAYDLEKTFYIISLDEPIIAGEEYFIYIEYVAEVYTNNLEGLYRNHYDDPVTGQPIYSAATQLQAYGARRVFPSFDEPFFKASFKTTIGRHIDYHTVSNTPLVGTRVIPGLTNWVWDDFNTTVPMSTYNIAIIISDFAFAEANSSTFSKPVRTYGPKHLIDAGYGEIPSEIAAEVLYFFEQFLGIEYAMHKMDSFGILDFAAGAMENWGLNIYSQNYLLYSPSQNNERDRRGVALTLNHELSHQWAGNLVTCDWWTMAWLNEGFATYLSYKGMQYTNPEYEVGKAFQYDCVHRAMQNDVQPDAHPTVIPDKDNPWETMSYNANLVYSKGAAILRMMEGFLTLETLQKGLQTYFKKYQYLSTTQDQLFEILTDQAEADGRLPSGATIKEMMDTWTLQKGFPLVTVTKENENSVSISQEEYRPDNETSRVYYIPLAISTESQPNVDNTLPQYWLFQQPNGVFVDHNASEWIVVNSGATGYYRVEYDTNLTQKLQDQLVKDHEVISLGTRTQLIDDYFTYAFDRETEIENALCFTKYLSNEIESSVWNTFTYHLLGKPRRMLLGSIYADALKSYLLPRVSGALTRFIETGANLDVGAANLFYTQLIEMSVNLELGNEEVYAMAIDYYEQWKRDPTTNPIPPLIRQAVHCAAISTFETDENFLFAIARFQNETNPTFKTQLLAGLACTTDSTSIAKLLGVTTGVTQQIPKQYVQSTLSNVAANPHNREVTLAFLDANFDRIVLYTGSARIIANGISYLSAYYSTTEQLETIDNFILKHATKFTDAEDSKILIAALSTIQENIKWMEKFGNPMAKWFTENV